MNPIPNGSLLPQTISLRLPTQFRIKYEMTKKLQIRNSTAEFLTFASQNEGNSIEVRFEDNSLWLTQQLIAELFQTSVPNISMHIKSIYEDKELETGGNS